MKNRLVPMILSMAATLWFGYGCSRISAVNRTEAAPSPSLTGKTFTSSDLQKLRWIEGTWRGAGAEHPFYERYKFENDSTLAVETLEGEKSDKVKDVTRFQGRGRAAHLSNGTLAEAVRSLALSHSRFLFRRLIRLCNIP